MSEPDVANLGQLLDRIEEAARGRDRVALGPIVEAIGRRSFGPLLLVPGLIAFSPLSGIPGMATTLGVFVSLIAGQLVFGRRHFWLPQWLLRRSVSGKQFAAALRVVRPPARLIDRFLRPRLHLFTGAVGTYGIALLCFVIALAMPPMEFIPFSVTIAGAALITFGLALIAHDGLVVLFALALTAAGMGFVIATFL